MEQILSDSQTNLIQAAHNREYRDRLFKAIFGRDNEQSKKWRLELYNALNNTSYTDPDATPLFKKTANRCMIMSGMSEG